MPRTAIEYPALDLPQRFLKQHLLYRLNHRTHQGYTDDEFGWLTMRDEDVARKEAARWAEHRSNQTKWCDDANETYKFRFVTVRRDGTI